MTPRQSRHGTVWTPIRSDARYVVATRPGGRTRTFTRVVWERMAAVPSSGVGDVSPSTTPAP